MTSCVDVSYDVITRSAFRSATLRTDIAVFSEVAFTAAEFPFFLGKAAFSRQSHRALVARTTEVAHGAAGLLAREAQASVAAITSN